jgi:D-alanyl-D-alanine-carboxypeptidase/D-alanyl-D-alanine-endopeptidase
MVRAGRIGRGKWRGGLALIAAALAVAGCQPKPDYTPAERAGAPLGRAAWIPVEMQRLYLTTLASGAVVTVVDADTASVRGYGQISPKNPQVPNGRTLVRLQSLSKLLNSDLLSAMVAAGQVKLTDPLSRYAPPGWQVSPPAKPGDPPITLVNLASHTSGLPREGKVRVGDKGDVAHAERWAWLATETDLPTPGHGAQYSNIGFDLLGDALSAAARTPYPTLLAATVTMPLGMTDTTPTPTPEQCARMLSPDPLKRPFPCVDQIWEAGSGGIYSTGDDIALWMKAQLAPPGGQADRRRISQALYFQRAALHPVIGLDHAGPANAVGLAWIELAPTPDHPRVLEKTGGGDGFLTYMVIDPKTRVGVFVAFNNLEDRRLPVVAEAANELVGLLAGDWRKGLAGAALQAAVSARKS